MLKSKSYKRTMVIRVVEFSSGGTNLERYQHTHTQRKLLNFENWCNGKVSKIGHPYYKIKWFKNWCYPKISTTKNWERFRWFLTEKIDFECQIKALFDITPILKIQLFSLGMLIFRQKYFQFCTPTWKLNNLYYHSTYYRSCV